MTTTDTTPWIVGFADAASLPQVGGKALGLHRLTALGLPVPPGFVITTAAFRAALVGRSEVAAALAGLDGLHAGDTEQTEPEHRRPRRSVGPRHVTEGADREKQEHVVQEQHREGDQLAQVGPGRDRGCSPRGSRSAPPPTRTGRRTTGC